MVDILFGSGIDGMGCMVDAALDVGVIERRGSWYAFQGQNIAQGRQNVVELLKEDPSMTELLESQVRQALVGDGAKSESEDDSEAIEMALADDFVEPVGADILAPTEEN